MASNALQGSVALFTGAGRGIGAACSLALARSGAAVMVHYNTSGAAAEDVVATIREEGGRGEAYRADLTAPAEIEQLVSATVGAFGALDILINNAATGELAPLEAMDAEHIDRVLGANVRSVLLTTRAAVAHFGTSGGSIVNVSSINAERPVPGGVMYSATKAAAEAITKGLATELGPRGIRVNAVAPGPTDTEMLRSVLPPGAEDAIAEATVFGQRLGEPTEIAEVVTFLASPASRWVTGQVINASGGLQI